MILRVRSQIRVHDIEMLACVSRKSRFPKPQSFRVEASIIFL